MAGYFVLKNSSNDGFRFVLKAGNHEIILTSQIYKSKASAENGIASVQKNAPLDERYNRLVAKNGEFYFTLEAGNGQVIGNSETYVSQQGRDNGIESVKRNGPSEEVRDETAADEA